MLLIELNKVNNEKLKEIFIKFIELYKDKIHLWDKHKNIKEHQMLQN